MCPVAALLANMAVRGGEPSTLFRLCDGHWLTKETFVARVRYYALSVLGYDSTSYTGHSLRIRVAMMAAECGIESLGSILIWQVHCLHSAKWLWFHYKMCLRPYHTEYTGSRLITEVKQFWACPCSIWMGDRLGTTGVVGFLFSSMP